MTFNASNVEWRQLPDEETTFVVRMPIILAPAMGSSDVSVTVGDNQVIIVKAGGSLIWQCRMYAAIEDEVEWTLEDNKSTLVMEITKKQGETWPSLLSIPLKSDDSHLLTKTDLDDRIARELPCLPAEDKKEEASDASAETVEETEEDGEAAEKVATEEAEEKATSEEETTAEEEEAKKDTDGENAAATEETKVEAAEEKDAADLLDDDDLLNDALDEVIPESKKASVSSAAVAVNEDGEAEEPTTAKKTDAEAEAKKEESEEEKEKAAEELMAKAQIQAELRGIDMEKKAITDKLEEMKAAHEKAEEGSEEKTTLGEHIKIASRMLELVAETRALRSHPATIESFIKVQIADIQKARVNIGETAPYETEDYQDDEEKTLTGLQLFKSALQYLNRDPAVAVHLLRLAAIHHNHAPSVIALFSIYTNVPSSYPRGASLILQNALRGEGQDVEARTNSRVGDLFNSGTRHFPPIFSMAVFFHQRAAIAGVTHSMVALAQLFLNGECSGDDTMSPSMKRLNKDEKRANYFLQCAIDRGSIVAYLVRAAQYAEGADGMPKSVEMAKKYYERAIAAESSLASGESKQMRIGTRMTVGDLQKIVSPAAAVKVTEKPATTVAKPATKADDDDDEIIELRPSANRNAAPSSSIGGARIGYSGPTGGASSSSPTGVVAAPAKRNAFVNSNNKRKATWESAARWGVGIYAAWVLAFPLRLVLLPFFYDKVATVMSAFGLGGAGSLDSSVAF